MQFIPICLPVLAFAVLGVQAKTPCNASSVAHPVLTPKIQGYLDALANSPVFHALKVRETDVFGNEIFFGCQSYETCIMLKTKLLCADLKIDDMLGEGSFVMESGTKGSLRNGRYELKQQAGLSGGRTMGNFISGPYNTATPSSTATGAGAKQTEECGAAFLIGTKTVAGCIDDAPTTGLATKTTAKTAEITPKPAETTEECGAEFLIGTKIAAGCISDSATSTSKAGGMGSAKVAYGVLFGAAGVGLMGL